MLVVLRMEYCLMCAAECLRCMYCATFICGYMVIFIFIINDFMKTCPGHVSPHYQKTKINRITFTFQHLADIFYLKQHCIQVIHWICSYVPWECSSNGKEIWIRFWTLFWLCDCIIFSTNKCVFPRSMIAIMHSDVVHLVLFCIILMIFKCQFSSL